MPTENIINVYNQASLEDIREGMGWYSRARAECMALSKETGVPLEVVVAIVAVLSPRTMWERNLGAARNLINGQNGEGTGINKRKGREILAGGSIDESLKGPKVRSFYRNILDPHDPDVVTCDVWAARVAGGPEAWERKFWLKEKQYFEVANDYREAAALLGILPSELQAITWVTIRRISK